MLPRRAFLALVAALAACNPPTPAEQRRVQRWLLCEECTEGELDSVLALGSRGEKALEAALNGPPRDRLENMRRQAEAMYARIPTPRPLSQQRYVDHFLGNYRALYARRAADALGRMTSPTAHAALVTALRHDTLYREDVRRLLGGSAHVVASVVAGDSQNAPVDSFVRVRPVIEVRDNVTDRLLSGMRVVFRVDSGAGHVTDSLVYTDTNGRATVGWRLGPIAAVNVLAVVVFGRTLRLRALGQPVIALAVIAGDSQHAPVDSFVRARPVIEVRDSVTHKLLTGMRVVFRVDSGAGHVTDSLVYTDTNGRATARWRLGPTDSVNVLAVHVAGRTLRLRALGHPNGLRVVFMAQPPNGKRGQPLTPAPRIAVEDAWGAVQTSFNGLAQVTLIIAGVPFHLSTMRSIVGGEAVLSGITVPQVGTGFKLRVIEYPHGVTQAFSAPFDIAP